MIKAPFRFDVDYFSLIILFRNIYYESQYHFKDEKEKDRYINNLIRNHDKYVTNKMIREIEQNGYYIQTKQKPTIYIIVFNNQTHQIRASTNNNDNIGVQIKFFFKDTFQIYSYIRNHCNSHHIKMTNKGSMIIDYMQGDNILEQIKIQSQTINLHVEGFEEFWTEIKSAWNRRKQPNFEENEDLYDLPIKQGTINIFNKSSQARDKEDKNTNPQKSKSFYKPKKMKQLEIIQSQLSQSNSQTSFMSQSRARKKIVGRYKSQHRPIQYDNKQSLLSEYKKIRKINKPITDHHKHQQPIIQPHKIQPFVEHKDMKKSYLYVQNDKRSINNAKYSSQQKEQISQLKSSQLKLINEIIQSRQLILSSFQSQAHKIRQSSDTNNEIFKKSIEQFDHKLIDIKDAVMLIKSQIQRLSKKMNQISSHIPLSQPNQKVNNKINIDDNISSQVIQNIKTSKSQSQKQEQITNKDLNQQHNKVTSKTNKKQFFQQKKQKKLKKRKQ